MGKSAKVSIYIREMEFEDMNKIYSLGEKLFTAAKWANLYRTWDEYEIMERYISDKKYCLVAEIDGRIVGFALGSLISKRKSSWTYGYLIWLGVMKKYSGLGIGKKLLNKLTDLFVEDGARIMFIDTAKENGPAIRFFEKNGFENQEEHIFLSKNISKPKGNKK